ncbi:MAG: hypothetical protein ACRYGH_02695 [Janthinobacterium lividum]
MSMAPPAPVVTLAEPLKVSRITPALLPILKTNSPSLPQAQLKRLLTKQQLLKKNAPLVAWPAPARNTAGSGPYFSNVNLGAVLLLVALYALLITALIGGAIVLLVKLILHFTRGKSRRAAQPLALPRTGP